MKYMNDLLSNEGEKIMSYSRIDKLVRERMGTQSLSDASELRNIPINIVLPSEHSHKIEIMASCALGLSLRCFKGQVNFYCPITWSNSMLKELLLNDATDYGESERLHFIQGLPKGGPTLSLGFYMPGAIIADASGWIAAINKVIPSSFSAVSPAIVFATACAFAKIFNGYVLNDKQHLNEEWMFSLYDFRKLTSISNQITSPSKIHIGQIALLGAGAIGSGFSYVLSLSSWSAALEIIDYDRYNEENLETTMLIGEKEVLKKFYKADALAVLLNLHNGLKASPIKTKITKDHLELSSYRDVLVCAVDNAQTRRILDNANVGMIINGGVGGSTEEAGHILWSRHLLNDKPLSTLYNIHEESIPRTVKLNQEISPNDISDECSKIAYQGVSMAAPFLGLACSALLVASCAHRAMNTFTESNYLKFDLLHIQNKNQCLCL